DGARAHPRGARPRTLRGVPRAHAGRGGPGRGLRTCGHERAGGRRMSTRHVTIEHVDLTTHRTFEEARAILERNVPVADVQRFVALVASRASAAEIESAVAGMVGDLGFMVLAKLDQGPLTSLLGQPKKLSVFLISNPVLANRMFEQHRGVGQYAPLRVVIYEDAE